MTVFRDLVELRDDLENAGSVPAWREPSTAIGKQVQALARALRDRWVKAEMAATTVRAEIAKHAAEVDAQRATNERLTAEIDRLRALPVLRTCGECSKCEELFDAPTSYMCGIDTMIDVSPGAPPPAGCPRRGGAR